LGGIGKTQVAIEYAYRYTLEYQAIFWLAAETPESLINSLQQIANHLQLPERQAMEQAQIVAAVQQWLSIHADWLLIADNVEDLSLLQTLLPSQGQGSLLLTTRRQALGTLAGPLELPPMTNEEGVALLLRRARRLEAFTSAPPLSQKLPLALSYPVEAVELVRVLEGLPLALDQAGAYIEETGCSIAEYLQRYHDQRKQVLAYRGTHGGTHANSVTTTLLLAVEKIRQKHPGAADLLQLCSFLQPEAISEAMLQAGAPYLGPTLGPMVADPYQFDMALAALRGASLITRYPETQTLALHRLVQAVLQDQMEPAQILHWGQRVIRMLNAIFSEGGYAQNEQYVAHALACVRLIEQCDSSLPEASELLFKTGSYLMARGRYKEAEPLLQQALLLEEQQHGADHPAFIRRLEKQAELFWRQGRYGVAVSLLQQMLALAEQHLEPGHSLVADALNDLAVLYREQGNYEEAESLLLNALHLYEQQPGPEGVTIGLIFSNLALVYRDQGKYEQARHHLQRVLSIREQLLGPDHPETAFTLNELAILHRVQGHDQQAEELYLRALFIHEQHLGPEHPETANAISNLANVYRDQGKYEQAEQLFLRALSIREKQLEADHPDLAFTLTNLAALYQKQKKYEQAESLYLRALRIREQRLGSEHQKTAATLNDLATLYWEQGKNEQAETLYSQALAVYVQQLGPDHPQTVKMRANANRWLAPQTTLDREKLRNTPSWEDNLGKKPLDSGSQEQGEDQLEDFLRARCELHPRAWCRASELWQAYLRWVEDQRERFPLSRRAFAEQLKARGLQSDRTNTARIWRGVITTQKEYDRK
ncbi:MAG TPA: FxSxx-COOH system tetratricopeptide repeat protein, partial [Ktedonobacteraceae bacterium]|nr:FxSxx-COOH system tetratricopeptide repeat protein [Ktedonobacteraceae bacterium]